MLQCITIVKYLISKVKLLLSFINAFFIFNLLFDLCNCIIGHYIKVDDLLRLSFNMDPHDVSDFDHQSFFILDIVISEGFVIIKKLPFEEKMLPVNRNTLLVLDSLFDTSNRICWNLIQWDNFTSTGLHKNSHRLSELHNKSGFSLDPVILESVIIFKVVSAEEKLLLCTDDAFNLVDLRFDLSNCV